MKLNRRLQSGFTLLEMMLAMMVIGIVTTAVTFYRSQDTTDKLISQAYEEVRIVLMAARAYRGRGDNWPANPQVLVDANMLSVEALDAPFGGQYTFSSTSPTGTFTLSFNTNSEANAHLMRATQLPFVSGTGTQITTTIADPGSDAGLTQFYKLDGSSPLKGDMDVNGYNIAGINDLAATTVSATSGQFTTLNVTNTLDAGTVRAPQIISSTNPTYRIVPDGVSNLNAVTSETINVSNLVATNNITASRFVDSENTAFYLDPSSTSVLNTVDANLLDVVQATITNLTSTTLNATTLNVSGDATIGQTVRAATGQFTGAISATNLTVTGNLSASRFVDSDNTSFYVDPSGNSVLNTLRANTVTSTNNATLNNATVSGTLTTNQITATNATVNTNLTVSGTSTLAATNVRGTLTANSVTVSGQSIVNGLLTVTGSSTFRGSVTVNAPLTVTGTLTGSNATFANVTANQVSTNSFVDRANTDYKIMPSGTSRLNTLNINTLKFGANAVENGNCVNNSIGVTSSGDLLTCKSSKWAVISGGSGGAGETSTVVQSGNDTHASWDSGKLSIRTGRLTFDASRAWASETVNFATPIPASKSIRFCVAVVNTGFSNLTGFMSMPECNVTDTSARLVIFGERANILEYTVYAFSPS